MAVETLIQLVQRVPEAVFTQSIFRLPRWFLHDTVVPDPVVGRPGRDCADSERPFCFFALIVGSLVRIRVVFAVLASPTAQLEDCLCRPIVLIWSGGSSVSSTSSLSSSPKSSAVHFWSLSIRLCSILEMIVGPQPVLRHITQRMLIYVQETHARICAPFSHQAGSSRIIHHFVRGGMGSVLLYPPHPHWLPWFSIPLHPTPLYQIPEFRVMSHGTQPPRAGYLDSVPPATS